MDTKHVTPELSRLPFTVYEYAAIDIASRYKQAILFPDISSDSASLALQNFLKWFPFKISYVQTDNGLEYQLEFQKLCEERNVVIPYESVDLSINILVVLMHGNCRFRTYCKFSQESVNVYGYIPKEYSS